MGVGMPTKAKITAFIGAVAIIMLIRLIFFSNAGAAVFKPAAEAAQQLTYAYDSGASFYSFNSKGYYFCTKDGVKFLSSKDEQQWDEPINLTNPVLYGKCDILAVSEPKGRAAYVFNALGKLMECKFDAPILNFSVNRSGDLTVILRTSSGYRVEAYAPGFDGPVWRYVMVKPNIYPISADTSPDGRVTAISALDLAPGAGAGITTRIMFMYTNETDAMDLGGTDGVFAGETLPGQIARIYFMNNRLLAVSDKSISAYDLSGKNQVKKSWELPLTNRISRFCTYGEAGFAFITGGALEGGGKAQEPGTLNFYNMSGRRTGTYAAGAGADYLSMNWDGAIAGDGRNFYAVNKRGGLLWQYKSPMDLKQLIFIDNENTALYAGSTNASVMRRGA